ncbi:MAG: phosphotransferase [Burkholderiaceae bacterium]
MPVPQAPSPDAPSLPSDRSADPPPPADAAARRRTLDAWLAPLARRFGLDAASLRPASDDASFRRYFRLLPTRADGVPMIVMDAPPPMEDCRPFVHAARVLKTAGVNVPEVHAADLDQGFLLLDDFGATTFLDRLAADRGAAAPLYRDATETLVRMQCASRPGVFPDYDRALLDRELALFPDWYLGRHRGAVLTDGQRGILRTSFELLLANNLAQPRVFVHRDYHSRNLMLLDGERNPGVLDFQDAVYGPITYDLVSLLRDAYVGWDEEQVLDWVVRYWERARKAGLPVPDDVGQLYRDFEWMGLQRHLKILGIFARLYHRDGKDRYLADMPLVRQYAVKTMQRYTALAPLLHLVETLDPDSQTDRRVGYTF